MRAAVGKVFRKAVVSEMGRALPAFLRGPSTPQGWVLFTSPGTAAPWGHVLFITERWTDMFTIELARSETPEYPVGRYSWDLDSWRATASSCVRINRLEGTNRDTWWSPIDASYGEQLKLVAEDTYPPVQEAVARMPTVVAAAVEYVARAAVPLL